MRNYIGKYSVLVERDQNGDYDKNGFTYLNCNKRNRGGSVYRKDSSKLVAYIASSQKGRNMVKEIEALGIEVVNVVEYDGEYDIVFNEKDLDKLKDIFCISELSAKRLPESFKNHPRYKEIKQERFDALSDDEKESRRLKGVELRSVLQSKKESV